MAIMKRVDLTLDPEAIEILKAYKQVGLSASYVVRKALVKYYQFNRPKVDPGKFDGVDVPDSSEPTLHYD